MGNVTELKDSAVLGLKYNPSVWISEGASRFSVTWKNREIKWGQLLGRLRSATKTQETQAEYLKMTKAQQDTIKDVGGFVGGTLTDGHRKSDTVGKRYLLTFDLDFAPKDFCERMTMDAPYAWAIYSTHKHKPESPRLRLIIPLDRAVDPEEYEAISRKLAEEIGLEYFDSTTFQPARLMYWPSCSRDGQFVFDYNDGRPIKADEWLKKYPDWRDVSFWPTCPDEQRVQKKRKEKQQDPLSKKSLVGVFCRTYTVPEAIAEFLPDVYRKSENKDDRYTYTQGSTYGGLVIYDDGLFCYSNHSTDPAHGQDLNAFDLVRIHRYGELDTDATTTTDVTRLPSYSAMIDLIRTDKKCKKTMMAEGKASAIEDFQDEKAADPEEEDWRVKLSVTRSGAVEPTMENLMLILAKDEKLSGLRYNRLARMIEIVRPTYWTNRRRFWENTDDSAIYIELALRYAKFRKGDVLDAVSRAAMLRAYNPIEDYIKGLPEWDGEPRAESLFIDYLGAEDCPYTKTATKKWLLAALSRILRPGCKFDYVPVLSGPGGIGKSTLVAKLGGEWFNDALSFEDMRDKTAAEKLQGFWIMEIGELKGMRKTDVESVKSFISRQVDIYRPSYGRTVESRPRSCVIIGTSNAEDFLKDITGNRRFWPIECTGLGSKQAWNMTKEDVDQIWAEVKFYYSDMDEKDLTLGEELERVAAVRQIAALEKDERLGIVQEYLDKLLPDRWEEMDLYARRDWLDQREHREDPGTTPRSTCSVMEIWAECFRMNPLTKRRSDSDDIVRILLQLGWRKHRASTRIPNYGIQAVFKRANYKKS